MPTPITTYRDTIRKISPPWLQTGLGEKILYAIGLHLDGFGEALVAGVKQRFPGVYSGESLPVLGRDRRIRRGRTEADANYAARLTRWLDDHRQRGGPYALLAQLYAHYAPTNFRITLVYRSGRAFTLAAADGAVTVSDIAWSPDAVPARWARWWLVFDWPTTLSSTPAYADGNTWGAPRTWGSALTVDEVNDLRLIPREWGAAHANGRLIIAGPGTRVWGAPVRAWGVGTWGSGPIINLSVE